MNCTIRKLVFGNFSRNTFINSCTKSNFPHWPSKCVAIQKPMLCIRSVHLGSNHRAKIYIEIENEHVHSYLEKCSSYSSTLIKPIDIRTQIKGDNFNDILNLDWSCRTPNEVFDAFKCVSVLSKQLRLDLCSPKLENLCSSVINRCGESDDSQLLDLLQCLSLWPPPESSKSPQYYSLWSALDKVCMSKVKTWDINKNLLVADHWAQLNLARYSQFVKTCLMRIARKLERLSPQQYVQLMFYVNLCRKLPQSASKFEFEYALETLCNKLTLEELSIVSMGFFKTQTHLNSQRISEAILTRLESCFKSGQPPPPDSIMMASLLKFLRMCLHPTQEVILHKTLDAMLPHLKDFSLLCCLHVALLGTNIQVIHEGVLHSLCERFAAEMKNCRIKDIERLAFILTLYNYDPKSNPCIFEVMVSEIRNRVAEREKDSRKWEEIEKYGECFLRFLGFLTIREIFPLDLIEKALDLAVMKEAHGNKWENIGRVALMLDVCLEIYFPDQTQLRLNPALRTKLNQQYRQDLSRYVEGKKLSATDRLLVDVLKYLRSLSGSTEGVILHHILPHFDRPDIVFCIRRNKEFQNLSSQKYSPKTLHRYHTNSGIWYAVVPFGRNNSIKQSNLPVGPLVHKMSLLKKLGYKPVLVPWFEWATLANEEKESYLKNRIFN